ncbi:MAG: ABC transporter ATP-binding protein [Deltaproteobacteria bacterium]|nr:ABC transporter ATP-binding protein [Deltaproteobacteria bacterium]MBN2674458.1 ABC transporter ATP-binding protein [Deltaproteobacteria bacterium]
MIELRHIYKSYNVNGNINHVLNDINITFPTGVNMGILGLNGAGKSTMLRIMGGVEMPDEGRVIRQGRISWPIGFSGGFAGILSGEENCRFVARIYNEDVDRVVGFAQDFAEIGKHFFNPVNTYSSGMKARLAFGLSMAIDFNVYLVDEVTAVGDNVFKKKCKRVFDDRRDHSSIIMVSHSMKTIEQYCDKCAILTKGSIHIFDSIKEAERIYKAL